MLTGGCATSTEVVGSYGIAVVFGTPALADASERVELYLVDDCSEVTLGAVPDKPRVYERVRRGSMPLLSDIPTGQYGLYAYGANDECQVVAVGCDNVVVGAVNGGTLRVELTAPTETIEECADVQLCIGGVCQGSQGDACLGEADGAACNGEPGTCWDQACCNGCWDGTVCRTGESLTACGQGGGLCERCCDSDTCDTGRCEPAVPVVEVDVGVEHVCAVVGNNAATLYGAQVTTGELFCWGKNDFSQLGIGSTSPDTCEMTACAKMPQMVTSNDNWLRVSSGYRHNCGVQTTEDSPETLCWGDNSDGQAAMTAGGTIDVPIAVSILSRPSAGENHTCFASLLGTAHCMGNDDNGQLGHDEMGLHHLEHPSGNHWSRVEASFRYTCGVHDDTLYCWGGDWRLQLGSGLTTPAPQSLPSPVAVNGAPFDVGHESACAISGSDTYCWGNNADGRLGRGTVGGELTPRTPSWAGRCFRPCRSAALTRAV